MSERAFYLDGGTGGTFAILNEPRRPLALRPVLLLAPFGWEDMCSYRARRDWAAHLASQGRAVLRIDLPGTGDSAGGPRDADLAARWLDAVTLSALWLAEAQGAGAITAIGIGLGGLLACAATSAGAPIDELVLWNVPASGRSIVRAVKAAGAMEAAARGVAADAPTDGTVAASGYALSAETCAELSATTVGAPAAHRALVLGRDGLSADAGLTEALEAAGVEVSGADGPGYAQMTIEPQDARTPWQTIERVDEWITNEPPEGPVAACGVPRLDRLALDGLTERPVRVESPSGPLFAIASEPGEPRGDLAVLFLNAGPQRHTGPNRMWVQAARRWAAEGVPALRVDLRAIGDSDGDATALVRLETFYTETYVAEGLAALDAAAALADGSRVLAVGLCAGCYWATHAALADARITNLALLNPASLVWDEGLSGMRRARQLGRMMRRRSSWERLLRGDVTPARHVETARAVASGALQSPRRIRRRIAGGRGPAPHPATALFDGLRERGQRATILFTSDEPLHNELVARGHGDLSGWPNIKLELIDTGIEAHTLVPLAAQRRADEILDATLAEALRQSPRDGASARASAI